MDKKMKSSKNPLVRFRGWIQAAATLLTNIHIPNLFKGKIYQGNVKTMCVPGLNCYSCPAATGACPIGAFQAVVGSSKFKFTYYITGFFILLGVLLGRFICGFLCPFGAVATPSWRPLPPPPHGATREAARPAGQPASLPAELPAGTPPGAGSANPLRCHALPPHFPRSGLRHPGRQAYQPWYGFAQDAGE